MADQTVTLRIRTDANGAVAGIRVVTAETEKLGPAAVAAGRQSQQGFAQATKSASTAGETVARLRQQVLGLFGIAAGAALVRQLSGMADAYTNLQSRIRLVTSSQEQANAVLGRVFDIAQQTRASLESTGQLYVTLARSTADLGVSQAQLAQITATVNQSFAISRASADSARAAIVQLSQGLASGALRGDEFNSVAEQAPILMDLLAKSLGKTRGELREFAAQGGITSKILTDALLEGSKGVGEQFARMTPTIEQAGVTLSNAAQRFVGQSADMSGAATVVSGAISLLARNFDLLAAAVLTVSTVMATRFVAAQAAAAAASLRTALAARAGAKEFAAASISSTLFATAGRGLFALVGGWPVLIIGAATALGLLINRLATAQQRAEGVARAAREAALATNRSIVEGNAVVRQAKPNLILRDIAQTERSLRQLEQRFSANSVPVKTLRDRLSELNAELKASKAAADAANPTLIGQREAIDELIDATKKQVQSMREQIAAAKGGAAAVLTLRLEQFSAADATKTQRQQLAELLKQLPELESQLTKTTTAQAGSTDELRRLTEAGEQFRTETERLRAELAGPQQQAFAGYAEQIAAANKLLDQGAISVQDFADRQAAALESLRRTTEAISAQQSPISQLLDDLQFEGQLIGLSNTEREVAIALRQAEQSLQQSGIDLSSAEAQAQLEVVANTVRSNAAQQQAVEIAQGAAEDYRRAWQGATDSVLRSFGEFVAKGANNFKSLGRQLKSIAKSFLADLIAMFLRNKLTLSIGGGLFGGGGSAFASSGSGGNLFSSLGGLFGGGQSGGGGQFNGTGPLLSFQNPQQGGVSSFFSQLFGQGGGSSRSSGGFGGASAAGGIGGALFGSLIGGKSGATGGSIGGSLGGNFGPWGAAIGAVVGSIAGSIIGAKFRTTGQAIQLAIDEAGGGGDQFEFQSKKSLFKKKKNRTLTTALDAESQRAIDDLFNAVSASMEAAAAALAVDVPPLISGTFRREFDKKGNLTKEFSTIAGRVVNESQEAFANRLQAVNIIAVVDAALGPLPQAIGDAITQPVIEGLDDFEREFGLGFRDVITRGLGDQLPAIAQAQGEAAQIAARWVGDAEKLLQGAQFLLAASVDLKNGFGLLGEGGTLTDITALVEDVAKAGEPLLETYARLVTSAELLTQALSLQNQSLDLGREQFVRFAADIVNAAGGLDRAQALWTDYFNRFFADNERAAQSLTVAQQAAQAQFGDIGLDSASFASAEGLQQFRALFEQALPTLSADAVVQWLEAAQAIGVVIDAQAALNQALGDTAQAADEAAQALAEQLAAMLDDVRDSARDAANALSDFGLSDFAAGIAQVSRETARAVDAATALGATESDLAEIRALGAARAELLQRQAQADLSDLLAGVAQSLFELDASPLEIELARIAQAMRATVAEAAGLGASEEQLAQIRALAARQSSDAVEAEVSRLRDAFAQLAARIGQTRQSIADDVLSIRSTQPGFSESAFQAGQLTNLRAQLDGAVDPQQRIGLIDQIRGATLARYNAELAAIQQTEQAQQQAAQSAQQAISAQREALDRLRGFADTLGLSSNSPLTAFQRLDVARSVFDSTLASARGGDSDAISGLQQAAEALLAENRAVFGVSGTAVAEFERVQAAVRGVAGQGVRSAASFADPFQRASINASARIAQLQASTIGELQGLDDALATLAITQEADTEGSIEALRARFDQAKLQHNDLIGHIQPIFDLLSAGQSQGDAQLAQLQAQTAALQQVITGIDGQTSLSSLFLDKIAINLSGQEQRLNALVERLGRAIERSGAAGVRA